VEWREKIAWSKIKVGKTKDRKDGEQVSQKSETKMY
jgi:hypothetical protein